MLWPFYKTPLKCTWCACVYRSCNVLLNEASNLVVGQRAALWTAERLDGDGLIHRVATPEGHAVSCYCWWDIKGDILDFNTRKCQRGTATSSQDRTKGQSLAETSGATVTAAMASPQTRNTFVSPSSTGQQITPPHQRGVFLTAEASVRLDVLPQVSWPRNRGHSRTCQSPCQLRTAAQLQDPQQQTPHQWTRSDIAGVGQSHYDGDKHKVVRGFFFFFFIFKYRHHHFNSTNSSKIWSTNDGQKSSLWEHGGFWVLQFSGKNHN